MASKWSMNLRDQVFWNTILCHWARGSQCFKGITFLQNTSNHPSNNAVSSPRRYLRNNSVIIPAIINCTNLIITDSCTVVNGSPSHRYGPDHPRESSAEVKKKVKLYLYSPAVTSQQVIGWILLIIKPTRCTKFSNLFLEWNSTCFREFLCPSSGVFHCTHSNGTCHKGLLTACEQDQDWISWSYLQDVWHIPLLVCTVKNSWRWTEELSETCRVSFQG